MHCNLNVEMKQNWVAKEWKLDIDLKLTGTLPETSNILHFLVPGSNGEHGWRIPAIFCRKNKPILDIYSSVGDNHVHSYKTKELNLNQWYSFRSFSTAETPIIFQNVWKFLLETEKVFFKNDKTKKLKTVPFGETLMFSKSGSTESKFTQVDLITSILHLVTSLFIK